MSKFLETWEKIENGNVRIWVRTRVGIRFFRRDRESGSTWDFLRNFPIDPIFLRNETTPSKFTIIIPSLFASHFESKLCILKKNCDCAAPPLKSTCLDFKVEKAGLYFKTN